MAQTIFPPLPRTVTCSVSECHSACQTCIGEGSQGCTKCRLGYRMVDSDCKGTYQQRVNHFKRVLGRGHRGALNADWDTEWWTVIVRVRTSSELTISLPRCQPSGIRQCQIYFQVAPGVKGLNCVVVGIVSEETGAASLGN